jgi:uncharacterized protein (DUF608 family)
MKRVSRRQFLQNTASLLAAGAAATAFTKDASASAPIDYGAGKVNSMGKTNGVKLQGDEDYNYFALENHSGPSGVPVGGIGAGCFDYAPDGRFTRVAINNWHSEGGQLYTCGAPPGTFLAIWRNKSSQLLHRSDAAFAGMPPAKHTVFRGLFPTAECVVDDAATVHVWSGLCPHNVKDSSLPLAWIEVTITNPMETTDSVSVALSWQDLICREIRDVRNIDLLHQFGNTAWQRGDMEREAEKEKIPCWSFLPRITTSASAFSVMNHAGIRQYSEPLKPIVKTYQNYNNEVAIVAEKFIGAEITTLPAYSVDQPEAAWASFRKEGRLDGGAGITPLFNPIDGKEMASAVAVRMVLKPHENRTVRFLVSWFQPEIVIDTKKDDPASYFGKADYGRYFHNFFPNLSEMITYAAKERERIYKETVAWHKPVMQSTYPDWLKFMVINSAYTMYTNTILNKAGDFTVMEGGMGGLAGTMDQRISAHPFYFKFFPSLDRSDLELFGHTPGREGQILHFDGHYYCGLASRNGETPTPDNSMVDNTGGWLLQIAKDWQQHGDIHWIHQFEKQIRNGLKYLRGCIASKRFDIITGATTYDDFWHPQIYAYNASTYPAFLKAGAVLMKAMGDIQGAFECENQAEIAAQDAIRALWNGQYFAYGSDLDGSNRRDDIMFSGQLAGQFLSRYCTWGDIFPMDVVRASVVSQLKTNIVHSPDFYAPKVWSIKDNRAMNDPQRPQDPNADSTCWPFYLQSYTAMAAIQAGYVDDGLNIMRHIQLLNLRNGWTWSQNLWRPGELTYVTAPVTWFITDVLAGSGLDIPNHTLYLSPLMHHNEARAIYPLFFPRFWAILTADRKKRKLTLKITHVFDGSEIILSTIVSCPSGVPSSKCSTIHIPKFKVQKDAGLDVSEHWDMLMNCHIQDTILPKATQIPFLQAHPKMILAPSISPEGNNFTDNCLVSLACETANTEIYYTLDNTDPRSGGILYTKPFLLKKTTAIQTASKLNKAWSPVRQKTFTAESYRNPDLPSGSETSRWRWTYYEGKWDELPHFDQLPPVSSGESEHLNLDMHHQDQYFGVVFNGVFTAKKRGVYIFHLTSDDGSRITIGGKDILDNDGIHDVRERTLTLPLNPGCYSLKLEYFQNDGGFSLKMNVDET